MKSPPLQLLVFWPISTRFPQRASDSLQPYRIPTPACFGAHTSLSVSTVKVILVLSMMNLCCFNYKRVVVGVKIQRGVKIHIIHVMRRLWYLYHENNDSCYSILFYSVLFCSTYLCLCSRGWLLQGERSTWLNPLSHQITRPGWRGGREQRGAPMWFTSGHRSAINTRANPVESLVRGEIFWSF